MDNFLKKIIGDKKEWKKMEARAKALPGDYQVAYSEIKNYMWKFSAGNGMDIVVILEGLLGLFEEGAADGKRVLEITGKDVAAFCDELLHGAKTYTENWRKSLNSDITKKLRKEDK
jgi:DNA-binding ferritin-like protein (Dps family)